MSSSICSHFTQNAWKKDLCSNCFKSKDEHKAAAAAAAAAAAQHSGGKLSSALKSSDSSHTKTDYPNKHKTPAKSIIKKAFGVRLTTTSSSSSSTFSKLSSNSKSGKVCFPKQLHEIIGYGGEWSEDDDDDDDDHDFMNLGNEHDDMAITETDDEEAVELKRITRANTDFNMNNGNLLGDAQDNIKKSFAALKLGAPQVDKEGKKQTLTINVMPFGQPTKSATPAKTAPTAAKTETTKTTTASAAAATTAPTTTVTAKPVAIKSSITTKKVTTTLTPTLVKTTTTTTTVAATSTTTAAATVSSRDGKDSPPIERAMEKSLLDEISETLQQKQKQSESNSSTASTSATVASSNSHSSGSKIKFELSALSDSPKPFLDLKKPIARNAPITKDQTKPKVNVCHKYSDTDSNCSDTENGVSAYYDVVETQLSYENLPDGKFSEQVGVASASTETTTSHYSSSQYITDMLLSSKTRAASYNLHEGNFMTSKITSDGLIVTKCSSDDALDSTGSSFDGSSDEENAYNMIRSESDSGIGISIGSEYKNLPNGGAKSGIEQRSLVEKKLSASTNNSDYEDIQIGDQSSNQAAVKSRELHGEPDGSADPDNKLEQQQQQSKQQESTTMEQQLPALPKSPPPPMKCDARPSFLHGLKKPELPAKPLVSSSNNSGSSSNNGVSPLPMKSFMSKRQPSCAEQQFISQLQTAISKSSENLLAAAAAAAAAESAKNDDAKLKKGKAPNPPPEPKLSAPPTPERDYSLVVEFEQASKVEAAAAAAEPSTTAAAASTSTTTETSTTATTSATSSNLYTKKPPVAAAAPVIREKDKRERAVINPKFRSLNTFVMQRANAAKQLQLQSASSVLNLKQPLTPEPTPRNQRHLSMSEECLAAAGLTEPHGSSKKSPTASPPQKQKSKFSIKKFLRMGSNGNKANEPLSKKDNSVYTEICTGDDGSVVGKPRLVIIHPIDINPTAVEVVKDITKTSDTVSAQTVAVVTAKPPAPPLRASEGQRAHEVNKPARPPPPKSAELRRKQKTELTATLSSSSVDSVKISGNPNAGGSIKSKADNVYANLGEIRSSIAPRKPERTASMREREAQLELVRKRGILTDTISICSSNGENVTADQSKAATNSVLYEKPPTGALNSTATTATSTINSRTSTFERQPKKAETKMSISSKLEIFEQRAHDATDTAQRSSLKDSVRKINSTIDSYLKDKRDYENMYELVKMGNDNNSSNKTTPSTTTAATATPPMPPTRSSNLDLSNVAGQRLNQTSRRNTNNNIYSDTASIASYTRSEYGPVRNYGLNNSLANIPRVISASYAGSEVGEFDIYAPYSYYGSEAGGDVATDINDSVWGMPMGNKNRSKATNRLRMRKGRSVVHKTIEDNYTAVVVANHEALAQVLDQLQQTPVVPAALRPLANAINLRFEDFSILDGAQAFVVGKKAFHAALWTTSPVTLALSADCNQLAGVGGELSQLTGGVSDVLNPITEFCDLVPSYQLPLMPTTEVTLLQATISVLPRLQLETLQSIGAILKGKSQVLDKSNFNFRGSIPNLSGLKEAGASNALRNVVSVQNLSTLNEESTSSINAAVNGGEESTNNTPSPMPAFDDVMTREVAFIMLQLVNGMKNLQAKAIEETPLSLSNVVLSKDMDNKDAQARLCVLQGNNNDDDEPMGTLCKCAHGALTDMLPATKITPILADILQQERAESLSKAKSVLEFVLWGPSDVALTGVTKERELALQRWLDLERATVLHGLVRTRVELTVYDECHLMFLVRSTAKMMNDAAKIVCSYQQQQQQQQQHE
ncbi:serine-rich adhesin for platelets [Drosophila sulfurigaster albostrigata]|uniref:serine-rich adhesin for platelets n=1 Tax=Drosophila sulfurigaster albostrigata TaxID=89887 RepID=UPI002D21E2FD|nr:serine-rich adhesin for platelets [Drosophila sulfurigaster albostrigata]